MDTEQRMTEMRRRLEAALQPSRLEIIDEGHKHVGHEGAKDGRGHFVVHIESAAFAGKTPLQRHRLVYDAMDELMQTDIHALTIDARLP